MTAKKWLVTGAAGFLGSHVTEILIKNQQNVLGIDDLSWGKAEHIEVLKQNSNSAFKKIDIRDTENLKNALADFMPDVIVHLAALHFIPEAIKKPTLAVDINVRGTQSLLEAAGACNYSTFWFASTGDVYTKTDSDNDELKTEVKPFNIYGLTKKICEELIFLEHQKNAQKKYLIGRVYNLIGPRETNPHIVPEIMQQLKKNPKSLSLGNIHPIRDYVPVDQCAQAIIDMCNKMNSSYEVCNVATGRGQSVKDLIGVIEDIMRSKIDVHIDPSKVRTVERERLVASVSKLKKQIGWAPSSEVKQILKDLLVAEGLHK